MDESIINNTNTERNPTSLTEQEYEEIIEDLQETIDELQETIDIRTKEVSSAKKDNEQLRKENSQLKRTPLFVASVIDILDSGEVYLRQQGGIIRNISPETTMLWGGLN